MNKKSVKEYQLPKYMARMAMIVGTTAMLTACDAISPDISGDIQVDTQEETAHELGGDTVIEPEIVGEIMIEEWETEDLNVWETKEVERIDDSLFLSGDVEINEEN